MGQVDHLGRCGLVLLGLVRLGCVVKGDQDNGNIVLTAIVISEGGKLNTNLKKTLALERILPGRFQPSSNEINRVLVRYNVPETVAGQEEKASLSCDRD